MKEFVITIYENDGITIKKTATAKPISLMFGPIRSIMDLLKIEDVSDTMQLLTMISDAWEQLTEVLTQVFPDLTKDDLDHVKIEELIPVLIGIIRYSFSQIMQIPKDPN